MLGFSKCSRGSATSTSHDEPDDGTIKGAWPCLGLTAQHEEDDESRGVLCGAVWPRTSRASSTPAPRQGDQEEAQDRCMGRLTSAAHDTIHAVGKHLPCYSVSHAQSAANSIVLPTRHGSNEAPQTQRVLIQAPKLKFDRVEMSRKMKEIVEQLKPLCAKVSTILNLELVASSRSTAHHMATGRPITTSEFIEPQIYGREDKRTNIIREITEGKYCNEDLIVLPIVGPGGIGKTTLTQYIYNDDEKLLKHFDIKLWACVSVNFNVYRLTQEIADKLTNDKKDSPDKRIEEQLKSKRFLLVLDDMWNCSNVDEWKRFLVPFTKGQTKGSVILVTTRFPALAQMVKTTEDRIDLEGLDHISFKKLFLACVFGDEKSANDHSELLGIGDRIVEKLKGSPLAAKTVGRLLRSHLDIGHWTRVLESKEWELQNGDHDIMPALKLSFDYLPFHLQQCFTYCALFPEDYKFGTEELVRFWIGLDILHSHGENKSIEDIGLSHLTQLVDHGFFKKEEDKRGRTYYIIHDLLHELAMKVSADECLSICSSNSMRSLQIHPSIRHLSINIDESSVMDKKTFKICREYFNALGKRLNAEKLRSLMIFGYHQDSFVKTFHGLFSKARALRVISISGDRFCIEDLLQNFLELVHLRYLRMSSFSSQSPNSILIFYHMRILDLPRCEKSCYELTRYMRNLIKLRHFCVGYNREMHSSIVEVGNLRSLQGLKRFVIKKESKGFELRQIGPLVELRGPLSVENLEKVVGREEAEEAKLMEKNNLEELMLDWNVNRSNKVPAREQLVLEGLEPHSNLLKLTIRGHGGATCPLWLGANLSVKNLESLHLDGVAWEKFPPIGQLCLVNEQDKELWSNIPDHSFQNLKTIELVKLSRLQKWVVNSTVKLFSHLEVLIIRGCPELVELSFSNSTCSQKEQKTWFPRLRRLVVKDCPKLSTFPSLPWTRDPCSFSIAGVGLGFEGLSYQKEGWSGLLSLYITGKHGDDSSFWMALDFDNLAEVEKLHIERCPLLPLDVLPKMSSVKTLSIWELFTASCAPGKELTQMLSYMPNLSDLEIRKCEKITGLAVAEQQKEATFSSDGVDKIAEGLLLLPPQLQKLSLERCPELTLRTDPLDGDKETEEVSARVCGLQGLRSLRSLVISDCPKFFSCCLPSSSSSCLSPFPTSLQNLLLFGRVEGMETLAPLSNLASLTGLSIFGCTDLRGEGLSRLLYHGCLSRLMVCSTPNFFVGCQPSQLLEQGLSFRSTKLQLHLDTDDVAGVLSAPVCRLLSSSLTTLQFRNNELERFTKEQEEALHLLASLQELSLFSLEKLQCLPAGLRRLTNLQRLKITECPAIRALHKDGLPDTLQELEISRGSGIRALPKDGLPSSLRLLDVQFSGSEELRSQCRKLIGTIPIVEA